MSNRKAKSEPPPSSEAYTVLARRYRPQQFRDIVGQEPVVQALVNALKANRVAHAYLFTGARGVGKTSTARILAKALNCVAGPTPTPCDACDICKGIASGEDVDVLEIDGASNRGIDEARDIRNNVQYRPSRARYKIYIIDEIHMLTKEAFNSLLKTLEEPPPHVKFIFATTEVQRIPLTILSRCQRFDFAGIGTPRIVEQLRRVVKQEGVEADDEALELVARRAAGSMRDAQSLLDQLLAFGGDRLTIEQVHQLLGAAGEECVVELAAAVVERDAKRALELLGRPAEQGLQLGELLDQLIGYWRDLMVLHCSGGEGVELNVSSRHRAALAKQAQALSVETILAGLDVLNATKARLRGSSHARVLVEMALVRLSLLDNLVPLTQLARWVGEGGARSAERGTPPAARPVALPEGVKKKSPVNGVEVRPGEPAASAPEEKRPPAADAPGSLVLSEATLPQIWPAILAQLGGFLGSHLEKAGLPAISGPNHLVIRFPPSYNNESEYCQKASDRILKVIRETAGATWNLRIQSAGGDGASPQPPVAANTANSLSRNRRLREEAEKEPLIRKAMEVLGAEIVRIDDGFGAVPAAGADRLPEATDTEEA
jgi:DNA polymerase-3 subunit gamma/tau